MQRYARCAGSSVQRHALQAWRCTLHQTQGHDNMRHSHIRGRGENSLISAPNRDAYRINLGGQFIRTILAYGEMREKDDAAWVDSSYCLDAIEFLSAGCAVKVSIADGRTDSITRDPKCRLVTMLEAS